MSTESLFIVASPRSGSTQLVQYVRQVPGCMSYGEIFKRDTLSKELLKRLRDPETASELFATDTKAFWDFLLSNTRGDHKIVGAKLFPKHRRKDPFWDYVFSGEPRVIYLWRARTFDTHISSLRSQATGHWQLKKDRSPAPETVSQKIRFDTARYLRFRESAREVYAETRDRLKGNPKAMFIEYSEITKPEALSKRFEEYFGVPVALEATLQKMTPRPAIEYVENMADAEGFVDDRLDEHEAEA